MSHWKWAFLSAIGLFAHNRKSRRGAHFQLQLWSSARMEAHKSYRPWDPRQSLLLSPSLLNWLPEDDLAYFILDVVGSLDLRSIEDAYQEKDARGTRPYSPRMLTALMVYGYCVGDRSSRRIEAATWRDVAFRVIAGGQHPDHSVISEFRRVLLSALSGLFLTTVRLAQRAGLVRLGQVALDGTKVQANASKHKAMSHGRMLKTEAELRVEIERMLAEAEQADRVEDGIHGSARRGDELPAELRRRTGPAAEDRGGASSAGSRSAGGPGPAVGRASGAPA